MQSTRYLLAIAFLCLPISASDQVVDEILNRSASVIHESNEEAEKTANDAQKVSHDDSFDWLTPSDKKSARAIGGFENNETAQQRAWNQIAGELSPRAVVDQGPPRPKVPDNVMYVYISLSMPPETIKSMFHQALALKKDYSVIFLLRGWEPPGPNALVAKLNKLFPEAQDLGELPNVQINPVLFKDQEVSEVPTFTTKTKEGEWVSVIGSTSIDDAIKRVEKRLYLGEVIGPIFDIEEPNILDLIQERIAKVDWAEQVNGAKSRALTRRTTGRDLPTSDTDESYLVDLTIINNRDLKGTTGEVFAKRNVSVNPFDYIATSKRYVFFNGNDPNQLNQALSWKAKYDYVILITTLPFSDLSVRKDAIQRFGQPVHEINELLIKRFKLRAVPAIAYQEGRMLRVDIAAKRSTTTAQTGAR